MQRPRLSFVALASSLTLLPLANPASAAQGQPARRIVADTGLIALGPSQTLRLTLVTRSGGEVLSADFVQVVYAEGTCDKGVCAHPVVSRTTSGPVLLGPGQGASLDIPSTAFGTRVQVWSSRRDLRVVAHVTDGTSNTIMFGELIPRWDAPPVVP